VLSETLTKGLELYAIGPKIRRLRLRKKLGLVQLGEHTVKVVTAQGRGFTEDSAVGLAIDPAQLYLFDRDSGRTLCCGLAARPAVDAA